MSYMLDTNVFNKLLDGVITLDDLPKDASFLATPIQLLELDKTPDETRRSLLVSKFHELVQDTHKVKTTLWNYSSWGEGAWDKTECYQTLKVALDSKKKKINNLEDALIAEVALIEGYILITADKTLSEVFEACFGSVILIPSKK